MEIKLMGYSSYWTAIKAVRPTFATVTDYIILCGDRITCCDEAVVAIDGEQVIGLATLAPNGEENSGVPTVVAVYVIPPKRKTGVGKDLLIAAIARLEARSLATPYRVDTVSKSGKGLVDSLPPEVFAKLVVYDYSRWTL